MIRRIWESCGVALLPCPVILKVVQGLGFGVPGLGFGVQGLGQVILIFWVSP